MSSAFNLDEQRQLQLPHLDHPEDGHTDVVYRVQLQGEHLVSASADNTARIWDLRTQRLLRPPLTGHTGSVVSVQFDATAHNDVIITGDAEGTVIVWRFSTGEAIKTIVQAHDDTILSLHFDDRYLVTGGRDKKVKLWNRQPLSIESPDVPENAIRPVEGDSYQPYSLLATFSTLGAVVNAVGLKNDVLVAGCGDGTMYIWSLRTGEVLQKVNIHQRGIACLQFNGRFVVSGSTDNTVRIYDVDQKVEVACLEGHTNLVRSVQAVFEEGGEVERVVSGSYDGSIRLWQRVPDSREWRTRQELRVGGFQADGYVLSEADKAADKFGERIFSVDLDAERFVCSGQGPVIRVWDLRSSAK